LVYVGFDVGDFTVAIDVNPDTSVIEEASLVRGDLEQLLAHAREVRVGLQNVDVALGLARGQEAVGDDDG
jgi:hypothetical protein